MMEKSEIQIADALVAVKAKTLLSLIREIHIIPNKKMRVQFNALKLAHELPVTFSKQ